MSDREKKRFSVIDFSILFVIVAALAVAFVKTGLYGKILTEHNKTDTVVSYIAEDVMASSEPDFAEGTGVYLSDRLIGETLKSSFSKKVYYENGSDGKSVALEDDSLLEISGTFKASLIKTDDGYMLNSSKYILPGTVLEVRVGNSVVKLTIISVENA